MSGTTSARRGWPRWAAVGLIAAVPTAAAVLDLRYAHTIGLPFAVAYVLACVGAVLAVRRRALFGVSVAPPLAMALAVILAVLVADAHSGMAATVLATATQLTSQFPLMAGVFAVTILLGAARGRWGAR